MAEPVLRAFVKRLMAEKLMPAVDAPDDFNLAQYRDRLLDNLRSIPDGVAALVSATATS